MSLRTLTIWNDIMSIVILGGGSAGTSIALELRKKDKDISITIIESTMYNEYSPCSLPYVLSGEIPGFDNIFVMKDEDYARESISLMKNTRVKSIDANNNQVIVEFDGKEQVIEYEKLVYALGSIPKKPPFDISDNANTVYLRTIDDAKKIHNIMENGKRIVIVGAGLIGTELAYSSIMRGLDVTLIEYDDIILGSMLDNQMSTRVKEYLENLGIKVLTNTKITRADDKRVYTESGSYDYDILALCHGLQPNIQLAVDAGITTGNGIIVDDHFRTSIDNIYAAGDCIEMKRLHHNNNDCMMLGSIAYQSAMIIAANLLGGNDKYSPVMGASITRIGDIIIGSTGITLREARSKQMKCASMIIEGSTRAGYYPESKRLIVMMISDLEYNLIGVQIIGGEDVAGRINMCSLAITHNIDIRVLSKVETVYNPASAPIHEPITVCARMLSRKIEVMRNAAN
ncbi:MAG: NAD(P)/FAD-dependent oxidoreductase [Candidatus Woesearchaeota archaeon]